MARTDSAPAPRPTKTEAALPAPSHRRAVGLLVLPAALLAVLIFGTAFAIAVGTGRGGEAVEAALPEWIPWIIGINHAIVFGVVLRTLRNEGRTLADAGWIRLPGRRLAAEIGLGIGIGLAAWLVETRLIDPLGRLFEGTSADVGQGGVDVSGVPIAWLVVALVFPFVEETVYRGYGIGLWGRRVGFVRALAVSTALFGLLHWGQGTWGVIDTALLGLLYGLAYLWRRSLWAPTVGHMVYNGFIIALATWW